MKRATSKSLTRTQKADLAALEALPDDRIDTSDVPEILNWGHARRSQFYRPVKKQITLRLDADVLAWFKSKVPGGRGYQTEINRALRRHLQPDPLADASQKLPSERFATYSRLWQFETWLRTMVYVELRARHGDAWHHYLKLPNSRALENDKQLSHMPTREQLQTSFMQLSDLLKTISCNWELFQPYLPPQQIWDARLLEVSQIRNRVAHFRAGHDNDLDRVQQLLKDIDRGFWAFCTSYNSDSFFLPPSKDEVVNAFLHLDPFPWTDDGKGKWARVGIADSNQPLSMKIGILRREWLTSTRPEQIAGEHGYLYSVTILPRRNRRIDHSRFLSFTQTVHSHVCHICLDYSPCSVRVTLPSVLAKTALVEIIEGLVQGAQHALRPEHAPRHFQPDSQPDMGPTEYERISADRLAEEWPEYVLGPSNPMTFLCPDMPCSFFGVD